MTVDGIRGAAMSASASTAKLWTVAGCDRRLGRLRLEARAGSVEQRELARLAIDEVLDRRNELVLDASRMGAQS